MSAYDPQNIFAKIIAGEISSHSIWDSEHVLAIMDVNPQVDGHALVIPKSPCRNMLDAQPEIFGSLFSAVQTIAQAAIPAFDADGVGISQFNEAPAGQSVFHLHVHVLPRVEGVPLRPHGGAMADQELLAAHAQRYRDALANL